MISFSNIFESLSFDTYLPTIQKNLNVTIKNKLGESAGVAYLTTDNKVLKIASGIEPQIAFNLIEHPNRYFPKIFDLEIVITNKWYAILKEFIPSMPHKIKKEYQLLEEEIFQWIDDKDITLFEAFKSFNPDDFKLYLENELPHLLIHFNSLKQMIEYADRFDFTLDIHDGNLGYKNNHLVLFDF